MQVNEKTIRREQKWADEHGVTDQVRKEFTDRLLLKAQKVYDETLDMDAHTVDPKVAKLQAVKLKAASDIAHGTGVLRKESAKPSANPDATRAFFAELFEHFSNTGELDPAEQAEMRAGYGIDESGLGRIARAVWEAGGLITYFTAGEPEVRAWPCEKDAPAPVAASKIHTDFEKHFIRAEVTSVDELVAAGSMDALRAAGKLRVEGREYRVKDGDVVFFRIGKTN